MQQELRHNSFIPLWVHALIAALVAFVLVAPFLELDAEATNLTALFAFVLLAMLALRYKKTLLYLLAASVPLSTSLTIVGSANLSFPSEIFCLALSTVLLVKIIWQKKITSKIFKHPISILLLLDIAWLLFTSFFSGMPEVSFKRVLIRIIYDCAFYFWMLELFLFDFSSIHKVILVYMLSLCLPIVYTLFRHASINFMMIGSQQLCQPFYVDHTIYGASVVFFIPYCLYTISRKEPFYLVFIPILALFLAAAWFSYSRAAWLSLAIALLLFAVLHFNVKTKYILSALALALVVLALNFNKFINTSLSAKEKSHTNDISMHIKSVSNVGTDASNRERINRRKCALRMWADKPILGFGPGTYQFFYGAYQVRSDLTRISTFTGNKGHSHNEYLNYLSETGLPGLLIFLALLFVVFKTSINVISQHTTLKMLSIALLCSLCTFVIHAFFNGFLEFDKMAFPVFMVFAALAAIDYKTKSNVSSH